MHQIMGDFARKTLRNVGLELKRAETISFFEDHTAFTQSFLRLQPESRRQCGEAIAKSKSQCQQDLFVLGELDFKRNGYFVEFGATNGIDLSNSHLLEKEFGWTGILAEPAKIWHDELTANRSANIEKSCVWKDSDSVLKFSQTTDPEFSTISDFSSHDHNIREAEHTYDAPTISLADLLEKYQAPQRIDYLSIDTEGSEFDILSSFDFNKYSFRVITCEHAYTQSRERVFKLLRKHGYERKYESLSGWDDWYVHSEKNAE